MFINSYRTIDTLISNKQTKLYCWEKEKISNLLRVFREYSTNMGQWTTFGEIRKKLYTYSLFSKFKSLWPKIQCFKGNFTGIFKSFDKWARILWDFWSTSRATSLHVLAACHFLFDPIVSSWVMDESRVADRKNGFITRTCVYCKVVLRNVFATILYGNVKILHLYLIMINLLTKFENKHTLDDLP